MSHRTWGTKEPGLSSARQQKGWRGVSDWSGKVLIQQMKGEGGTETKTQRHKQYRRLGK